ncbi:MAG: class I SAM-dependent methyltransferase [Acidobacteria bacterium]|nr:class I SAM-dependent methyltransferase [Acidobacteriota bacterium]
MKRTLTTVFLLTALSATAVCQRRGGRGFGAQEALPTARGEQEAKILAALDEAVKAGELYANVPVSDGMMLRILAESVNAKNVVEIGTSTGLSGLWFSLALDKTGGRLTTFELDAGRAATALAHFKKAGVDRLVTIVQGDAHETIKRLKEPIDVVFIDAEKEGYVDYLNRLLPLVRPGGLILAHNIDMVPDYYKVVTTSADLATVVYAQGGGLAVTLKKR